MKFLVQSSLIAAVALGAACDPIDPEHPRCAEAPEHELRATIDGELFVACSVSGSVAVLGAQQEAVSLSFGGGEDRTRGYDGIEAGIRRLQINAAYSTASALEDGYGGTHGLENGEDSAALSYFETVLDGDVGTKTATSSGGTLTIEDSSASMAGTFSGTLVDGDGVEIVIEDGSFSFPKSVLE